MVGVDTGTVAAEMVEIEPQRGLTDEKAPRQAVGSYRLLSIPSNSVAIGGRLAVDYADPDPAVAVSVHLFPEPLRNRFVALGPRGGAAVSIPLVVMGATPASAIVGPSTFRLNTDTLAHAGTSEIGVRQGPGAFERAGAVLQGEDQNVDQGYDRTSGVRF